MNELADKHHLTNGVVKVGSFAGFELEFSPSRSRTIIIRGKNEYSSQISGSFLGTISSLEHTIRGLDEALITCQKKLFEAERRVQELLPHQHKSFEHETKLAKLVCRQQEIIRDLDLTKNQASSSVDAEPSSFVQEAIDKPKEARFQAVRLQI